MSTETLLTSSLGNHDLSFGVVVGSVAVLVVMLLRRRPSSRDVLLYLLGAFAMYFSAPLLEGAFAVLDSGVVRETLYETPFWRALAVGGFGTAVGLVAMSRSWANTAER